MKFIKFTDGTRLALYSYNAYYDRVPVTPGVGENWVLNNAFLTVGTNDNIFINAEQLNGTTLKDYDGNTWTFILQSSNTMRLTVTKGNVVNSVTFTARYSSGNPWTHFLVVMGSTENGYNIYLGSRRPSLVRGMPGSGSNQYLNGSYVDGYYNTYSFVDDVALASTSAVAYARMNNKFVSKKFISANGFFKNPPSSTDTSEAALTYYTAGMTSGTYGSVLLATLTEKSIDETGQPDDEDSDPYSKGGNSAGGGGTGTFSRTGDTIGEHGLPTLSAVNAGFITLFAPTQGEMRSLANYLWSNAFSVETFKKIFANPMDCILGLSIVPVQVPTSGSASVNVGNIPTGVSMTKASSQYVKLDCGTLNVEEYWGAYLDYDPYTKCEIYLPYIGIHQLAVDDIMNKSVQVIYYIDILSGACVAEIYTDGTCTYSFIGQCSSSIPITGNDWTNVINGVMGIAGAGLAMVASGGLTAPMSLGGIAKGLGDIASSSSTVTSSKPSVERSGAMSGTGGMLGQQTPYLIITWPRECIPASQNAYSGYPSFVTVALSEIEGYNVIHSIHLENVPCTGDELTEIENLLTSGVIITGGV